MNLVQLRYFRETFVCGSFSNAAKNLQVTQPAISSQIKILEKSLGTKLLFKRNGRIHLTESGRTVLNHAIKILEQCEAMGDDVKTLNNPKSVSGNISFGCGPLLSKCILPNLITGFLKQYPDVNLSIIEADSSELYELLEKGLIDVGLGVRYGKSNSFFPYKKLFDDEFVFICSAKDGKKNGEVFELQHLQHYPFINNSPGTIIHSILEKNLLEDQPRTILYTRNIETAIEFVKKGLGVTLAPAFLVRILQPDNIYIKKIDKKIKIQVGIYSKPANLLSKAQKVLIQTLEQLKR